MIQRCLLACSLAAASPAFAGANPSIGWNYNTITATPHYPIVGETAQIAVVVTNPGDAPANNVQVKISFNDWGVTFQGWQEIATVTIPTIPAGGSATAQTEHVFVTRAHTCLEALVVGASENTDPNDDRGQINLEVINSGETFSWNVPVVNNGDQPLHLLLVGACRGRGDGADGQACHEDVKEVDVAPGQELLVPVNIDLRGFAVGEPLEFELNAFDLGAGGDAFLPANRNHVQIRIVRQTALNLAQETLGQIRAVAALVPEKGLKKRVEAAAARVDQVVANNLWADPDHVKKNNVFAHAQAAVNQLMALLDTDLPQPQKIALDTAARNLADAMRIVAKAANGDAASIQVGDDDRAGGDYKGAINAYKHAWR